MVFRITNFCDMGCPHCMMESTIKGEHASMELIDKMLKFAELSPKTKHIQISGGEPTSHPDILNILDKVLTFGKEKNIPITLISNGEFLLNDLKDKILKLVVKHSIDTSKQLSNYSFNIPNTYLTDQFKFLIQITSVPGLYKNHDERLKIFNEVLQDFGELFPEIFDNISITTTLSGIIPIGRAKSALKKDPQFFKEFSENNMSSGPLKTVDGVLFKQASACFNLYNALQHTDNFFEAIDLVKENTVFSLCKPLITEKGDIKFGEYDQCSTVFNLNDFTLDNLNNLLTLELDLDQVLGPCGSCVNNALQQSNLDKYITKYKKNVKD